MRWGWMNRRALMNASEYESIVERDLGDLIEYADRCNEENFDSDLGNGVVTLKVDGVGTWVINKQTPTRQIWWSSPLSGGKKFDWHASTREWIEGPTREQLFDLLRKEFKDAFGHDILGPL